MIVLESKINSLDTAITTMLQIERDMMRKYNVMTITQLLKPQRHSMHSIRSVVYAIIMECKDTTHLSLAYLCEVYNVSLVTAEKKYHEYKMNKVFIQ
jgi:hypothetical protein